MIRSATIALSKGGLLRVGRFATPSLQSHRHRQQCVPRQFFTSAPDRAPDVEPDSSPQNQRDYFDVLGIQPRFSINEDDVKSTYKRLMGQFHPDRHTLKPVQEQERQTERAAAVTRAYDILSSPHARAEHLLELAGNPITEMDGALVDGPMLMAVMELREAVGDASSDEELQVLLDENRVRVEATCEDLAGAFGRDDLDEAKRLTARLQYWTKIEEKIMEKISTVA